MAERINLFLDDGVEGVPEVTDALVCAWSHQPCGIWGTDECCGSRVEYPAPWNAPKPKSGLEEQTGFVLDQTTAVDFELADA